MMTMVFSQVKFENESMMGLNPEKHCKITNGKNEARQSEVEWQQALNAAIVALRTAKFQAPSALVSQTAADIGDR